VRTHVRARMRVSRLLDRAEDAVRTAVLLALDKHLIQGIDADEVDHFADTMRRRFLEALGEPPALVTEEG